VILTNVVNEQVSIAAALMQFYQQVLSVSGIRAAATAKVKSELKRLTRSGNSQAGNFVPDPRFADYSPAADKTLSPRSSGKACASCAGPDPHHPGALPAQEDSGSPLRSTGRDSQHFRQAPHLRDLQRVQELRIRSMSSLLR
jgi:hypothetical protein